MVLPADESQLPPLLLTLPAPSALTTPGVNINRGQEISLRLRTDDLKGEAAFWGRVRGLGLCRWQSTAACISITPAAGDCRHSAAKQAACPYMRCMFVLPSPLHTCAGFRRYDRIRETLLHELAHMVNPTAGGMCASVLGGMGWRGCCLPIFLRLRSPRPVSRCRHCSVDLVAGVGRPRHQLQAAEQPGGWCGTEGG